MRLETERLVIRDLRRTDAAAFVRMAADGSLAESIGFDAGCGAWMNGWRRRSGCLNRMIREEYSWPIRSK